MRRIGIILIDIVWRLIIWHRCRKIFMFLFFGYKQIVRNYLSTSNFLIYDSILYGSKNFAVQNFREIAENDAKVNSCAKNFVITTFFVIIATPPFTVPRSHLKVSVQKHFFCSTSIQFTNTTVSQLFNFCEESFHDRKSNHEIHENIVAPKIWSSMVVSGFDFKLVGDIFEVCSC